MSVVEFERNPGARLSAASVWLTALLVAAASLVAGTQQTPGQKTTGWVCGWVVDEMLSMIADTEVSIVPQAEAGTPEPPPAKTIATDSHGTFCLQDLPPGFYQLRAAKAPWPAQAPRTVEVRAGLVNRLTTPVEMELEPGEPRVSFQESFDGMSGTEARSQMERLLGKGDAASIQELARRLLPKRGPRIDVSRLVPGLDVKPLVAELMRQLETGYLPPLKTARYLFLVGELADQRTRDDVIPLLLRRLRDARRLPPSPYAVVADTGPGYVSDLAIGGLARLAGKDFGWKYGRPPLENQKALQGANTWWQNELARQAERKQR